MEKDEMKKWFSILIIVAMALSSVFILFSGSGNYIDRAIPTPTPTALPTPGAPFSGSGYAQVKVLSLLDSIAIQCDSQNDSADIIAMLASAGVTSTVYSSATTLIGKADINRTDIEANVTLALTGICAPLVSRFASFEVLTDVQLVGDANQTKTVAKDGLSCFAAPSQQCLGVVNVGRKVGDTVQVLIYVQLQGSAVSTAVAEESHTSEPGFEVKRVPATATVTELSTVWAAFADIPWEKRNFDTQTITGQLNGTGTVIEQDYQIDSTVLVENAGEAEIPALTGLAFVTNASVEVGGVRVTLLENQTGKAAVSRGIEEALKVSRNIVFPASTLSFAINSTKIEGPSDIKVTLPEGATVEYRRAVTIQLDDVPAVESELGATLEQDTFQVLMKGALLGGKVNVLVNAAVIDGKVAQVQVTQA